MPFPTTRVALYGALRLGGLALRDRLVLVALRVRRLVRLVAASNTCRFPAVFIEPSSGAKRDVEVVIAAVVAARFQRAVGACVRA